ncbi:MAG TPA: ACP S-malonyltransferase [Gammaproteobacteria bacterium]|nr:ACP S-malonyltransferase [Gammaproteobacteria bacterium]
MSLAFVFPGQGSQSVGMLNALAAHSPVIEAAFAQASAALGHDLWRVVREGPEKKLNSTVMTQPAMLAAGVAIWRLWRERGGVMPQIMAGHSLGEYTALVCADALDFEAAVTLVAARGRCMQEAVPEGSGAMAAIVGLELEPLQQICAHAAHGEVVACANLNAPGQIVIAGLRAAVGRAMEAAKQAGAKRAVLLPVSVPSHCELMRPAADRFHAVLNKLPLQSPHIRILHNYDVESHDSPSDIVEALRRQLYSPVRWIETTQKIAASGVRFLIEAGPGRVLSGLCKRIDKTLQCLPVYDPETLQAALTATSGGQ